ncbi:MAG TPA: glycogen phosphorylase [Lentisphaeria bacterium]|nr:MAG: glycogen phosphorylase [Lentisphaerae bacterium GWF2_38_69]HBM16931.1 glycogen phosphorylase [Lentisphaeria bacterium]
MLANKLNDKQKFEVFCENVLQHVIGKRLSSTTDFDKYRMIAFSQKAILAEKSIDTEKKYQTRNVKKVYYLSLEFLMGRFLRNAVDNSDMEEITKDTLKKICVDLEDLYEQEYDAGLGNGGLGRLAACFLDSMATMDIPGYGFGIRYEYGMFNQSIIDGWQVERPDNWLFKNNPWEVQRIEDAVRVKYYGTVKHTVNKDGQFGAEWVDAEEIIAIPYTVYVPGYKTNTVNSLILWSAKSSDEFNLDYFNSGDYEKAVQTKALEETISKVLYPNDNNASGKELRLKQQYFFVSASLQMIIRDYLAQHNNFDKFYEKIAIQLNDTHPSIAIAELMRLFIDVHGLEWDHAWDIVTKTFAYTNHTLMPEALEKWKVSLFERLLPRILEIIYEINARFLQEIETAYPGDAAKKRDMSLIEEGEEKKIRMAYLAIIGSHSINGVAKLHTKLLQETLLANFYALYPHKFNNKTNGITQRRWLKQSNPALSQLITDVIGDKWIKNLDELKKLEKPSRDKTFCDKWAEVKKKNKVAFSNYILKEFGFAVDPGSLFDMQVKRMHEYKRQLLNILRVIHSYYKLKGGIPKDAVPRTVFIGGKAAPGYATAKLIIKLVGDVSNVINNDPQTRDYLKLYFLPNYRVSLAERIFPASDLSQQISTAGTEASGTGNMKFALNGALTIGTLDGANIEMKDEIGAENMFIFGLTAEEVSKLKESGYNPYDYYFANPELKNVLDSMAKGDFSPDDKDRFKPLFDLLLNHGDQYMLLADFDSYIECNDRVDALYRNHPQWTKKSIINVANMGYFSSDRTIAEYARDIWGIKN